MVRMGPMYNRLSERILSIHFQCFKDRYNHTYSESSWHILHSSPHDHNDNDKDRTFKKEVFLYVIYNVAIDIYCIWQSQRQRHVRRQGQIQWQRQNEYKTQHVPYLLTLYQIWWWWMNQWPKMVLHCRRWWCTMLFFMFFIVCNCLSLFFPLFSSFSLFFIVWYGMVWYGVCWLLTDKSPTLRGPTCQGVLGLV